MQESLLGGGLATPPDKHPTCREDLRTCPQRGPDPEGPQEFQALTP